jgi:hypothetical protein
LATASSPPIPSLDALTLNPEQEDAVRLYYERKIRLLVERLKLPRSQAEVPLDVVVLNSFANTSIAVA